VWEGLSFRLQLFPFFLQVGKGFLQGSEAARLLVRREQATE